VPFPPGGPTDIVARPLAQLLGDELKTTVIIDNRGGAGGSLGANVVAKSAPDGYTLLMATVGTNAINTALYKTLPYDAVRDFTPIALVAAAPVAIVVHPSLPANDLAALVALAKKEPGKLNYGSAGNGSPGHLTGEMFKAAAGIDIRHVPYKGSAPAVIDLLAGQIQMMFDNIPGALTQARAGRVRALAVTSAKRTPVVPEIPAIAETLPGFDIVSWTTLTGPAKLPPDITARLSELSKKALESEDLKAKFYDLAATAWWMTPADTLAYRDSEEARLAPIIRKSGARVD
jgi:tripartite-type tricarboxylate transporter receptor subunit TctC